MLRHSKWNWTLRLAPACQAHTEHQSVWHTPPPLTTGLHLHDIHLPPRAAQVFEQQPRGGHMLRVCQVLGVASGGPLQGLHTGQAGESTKDSATLGQCGTETELRVLASACKSSIV